MTHFPTLRLTTDVTFSYTAVAKSLQERDAAETQRKHSARDNRNSKSGAQSWDARLSTEKI